MKTDGDKSTMIAYKSLLCFYVSCKSILKVSPSLSPQLRFLLPFITVISTFLGAFFGRRGLSVNKAVDDKRREKKTSQEERHIYGWTSRFLSQNPAFSARKSIQSQVNDIWKSSFRHNYLSVAQTRHWKHMDEQKMCQNHDKMTI